MNAQLFYGSLQYVNEIDDPFLSDDDSIADSEDKVVENQKVQEEDLYISETDESSSDEICEKPCTSKAKPKPVPRKKTKAPIWKAGHLPPYLDETFPFQGNTNHSTCINELETPADFFNFFFNDDLMNFLVDQSNLYALQVDINKPASITRIYLLEFGSWSRNYTWHNELQPMSCTLTIIPIIITI